MALANLNINVTANVNNAVTAMTDIKAVTNASMFKSSESVKGFQDEVKRTASEVQSKSQQMNSEIQKSSVGIASASKVSADSMSKISASADASLAGIKELSKGLDTAGAKVKQAMGPEAAAQVKDTSERIKEFVGTRIAIAAVGLALGAVAATIATVGYAAYKASGFLVGLFTGSSYKSKNIDALIEANKEVLELQKSLQMTAGDANALVDALRRVGVNKTDITSVYGSVESKRRGDMSEWDRLGVQNKGADGAVFGNDQLILNAKNALDQYTEGWDRNQAAVALGIGTHEQLSNYLKVNQEELQASKSRINEYNLAIGPETQEYVAQYQRAQREFNNELKLMGDGFKRVYADQIMPIFTTWMNTFKDGMPWLVTGTRHILAAFTTMGYGIKMVVDMMWNVISGNFKAIGTVIGGFAAAIDQARQGNFKGAKDILIDTGKAGVEHLKGIGTQIVKDAEKNLKDMKLAQGAYSIDNAPVAGPGSGKNKGKTFIPKPAEVAAAAETVSTDGLHMWTLENDKLWKNIQKHMAEDGQIWSDIYQLEIQDQEKAYQAMSDAYQAELMSQKEIYDNSPWAGMKTGIDSYRDSVKSLGDQFKEMTVSTIGQMEQALTNFVMTGKLNFKDLANSIISDMIRIQMRQAVSGVFGAIGNAVGNYFGGSSINTNSLAGSDGGLPASIAGYQGWNVPSFDVGTNYVPFDTLAMVHKGEAVIPAYDNKNSGNTNLTVNLVNQSGQAVKAKEGGTTFDGNSMVKTIVLEAMDTDPTFRWAMRGAA